VMPFRLWKDICICN